MVRGGWGGVECRIFLGTGVPCRAGTSSSCSICTSMSPRAAHASLLRGSLQVTEALPCSHWWEGAISTIWNWVYVVQGVAGSGASPHCHPYTSVTAGAVFICLQCRTGCTNRADVPTPILQQRLRCSPHCNAPIPPAMSPHYSSVPASSPAPLPSVPMPLLMHFPLAWRFLSATLGRRQGRI